jgi:hypothetical protein
MLRNNTRKEEKELNELTSATFGISKAAGAPRNLEGHIAPEPDAIACLLLSSPLRDPISRMSVVTADGPNMFGVFL